VNTWRRVAWGGLTALHLALAGFPASAQVTFFADNDARRAIKALQEKLIELEPALNAAIGSAQQDSLARSKEVDLQARQRLEASESRIREAIDRLTVTLNQRIDGTNATLRDELSRQTTELRAVQGVLKDNQVVLQGDMKDHVRRQDEFSNAAVVRLQDLAKDIAALKAGRVEVSRAIDQLREDVQKWLAPMQASLDQLTRDLTIVQRALRDQAALVADIQRKSEDAHRKWDERAKDLEDAQRLGQAQLQQALAERDARHAKLAELVEQKAQQAEERMRRAVEDAARRAEGLELALRQAQERAEKAGAQLAQADSKLAEAERRLAEADRRLAEADKRLDALDKSAADAEQRLGDVDQRLGDADKRLVEAEGRAAEGQKQWAQTDARVAELDARRVQADERALRMEARWRLVDEQARQRGTEVDLSPLGQRVGQIEDRLRKLEPLKVSLDGEEFAAQAEEKRAYDEAIGMMAKGDFTRAGELFSQFLRRYAASGYLGWVRFWYGQALMGQRDYRGAIACFRALITESPNHPKAPEAMLALASSQVELKDRAGARKSLEDLLRLYPDSDASKLGRQRLVSMK